MTEEAVPSSSQLVIVGASAGGIEALSLLVSTLPTDFPAPIIIAQHLDPRRTSQLPQILGARSALPVRVVENLTPLEPGIIFVIPPNRNVELTDHAINLRADTRSMSKPSIDILLTSAAQVFGEGLIAVILTGSGSDGANGARAVKQVGGTVIIQNPETASFPSMPLSLAPTTVDIVANLDTIGPLLHDLLTGAFIVPRPEGDRQLRAFLDQLRERSGIDFSSYKLPTITRRLQRRMAATRTENLSGYMRYLQRNPDEYQRLVNTFLIKVTEFFRDPDLFGVLRERYLPELITEARRTGELRIWSAGCATGEEAYSLAILVSELLGDEQNDLNVRIFATDLDGEAITFARRGIYPASALVDVPPELVERYFTVLDGAYEVKKSVRSRLVFGQHDLGQRAPFPRIDLALCRNVLIYFTGELQRRALQLFAFSLRDNGMLIVGKAETVTPLAEYFTLEQPRLKIYRRAGERVLIPPARIRDSAPTQLRITPPRRSSSGSEFASARVQREIQRVRTSADRAEHVLQRLPLGVVVVDQHFDIVSINNTARRLLGIHTAAVGEDFIHLVQNVPLLPLREAVDKAFRAETGTELVQIATTMPETGEELFLQIEAYPEPLDSDNPSIDTAVILITNVTAVVHQRRALEQATERQHRETESLMAQVRQLTLTNRQLVEANQELTAANAELRNANEELLVNNEEAQAATEEIETLNEELQATNEELETLNEELQATVEELNTTNDDLQARSVELQDLAVSLEDQRRASEAERARLAAILGSIGDAVLVVNLQGEPILTNAAYQGMFGDEALVPLDPRGQPLPLDETPQQRAARGEAFAIEFSLLTPEGTLRYFEANGQPVRGPEGQVEWGVVTFRDITDRSLRHLHEEFLALASHELRTPLTSINGYLELLNQSLREDTQTERQRRFIGRVLEAASELNLLVSDLSDVSRLDTGKLRVNREPVDLRDLVGQTVEAMQPLVKGQTIALQLPDTPQVVRGDHLRLAQVVNNLLNNAVVYASQSQQIEVRLRRVDAEAELQVQDYGPGIPAAELPHIFTRYYQVARPDSNEQKGLGLGLYLVKQLVAAHGGTIGVKSVEGSGSTFTVRLPLTRE